MPLTEIPETHNNYFRHTATLTQEIRSMVKNTSFFPDSTSYYLNCSYPQNNSFRKSLVLTSTDEVSGYADRQLALIYLSQHLLKNSQSLNGKHLGVMNKTSARLFSKTPTQL